jgi:hypothetical protein
VIAAALLRPSASPSAAQAPRPPTPSTTPLTRIAFTVNGRLDLLRMYVETLAQLPAPTRAALSVFFSLYGDLPPGDAGAPPHLSLAGALNASALAPAELAHAAPRPAASDSYTRGRNHLWRQVYAREVARGQRYAYWVVADGDTSRLRCGNCPAPAQPDAASAACCLNNLLGVALASSEFGFSSVGASLGDEEASGMAGMPHPRTFVLRDCTDGMLHAMHRDAVPIFLPYHEEFEAHTIFASQAVQFFFTSACTRGAGAALGSNVGGHNEHNQHTGGSAPASPDHAAIEALLRGLHPDLFGRVLDPARNCQNPGWAFPQSDTRADSFLTFEGGVAREAVTGSGVRVAPRVRWNETCAFAACLAARRERFVRETGGGAPEAPRAPDTYVGWVWAWQALSRERRPWWSNSTSMKGLTEECEGPLN